jgi:hypothetical protein
VERDDDIDTLKKEIGGRAPLSPDDEPKSISFSAELWRATIKPMIP